MRRIDPAMLGKSDFTPPSFFERETSRGTKIVYRDTDGTIVCSPNEGRRIATFGLCGCTAVASVIESTDGQRRGYIQHYSFRNEDAGVQALGQELRANAIDLRVARLVIMTPGTMGPSGKFPLEPANNTLANVLTLTGRTYFGEDADIQVYAYEETQKTGETDQGTLMIVFPAGGVANVVADGRLVRPLTDAN